MTEIFYKISLPFATLGLLGFLYFSFARYRWIFAIATLASFLTFSCLSVIIVSLINDYGLGIAFVGGVRYLIFAWLTMLIYFIAEFRYKIRLLGPILMPLALILILVAAFDDRKISGVNLNFGSFTTLSHVALVLLAFSFLFLSFAGAILFLLKRNALKNHLVSAIDGRLPTLTTSNKIMEASFYLGFPILTVGLILGIIYAGSALKSGWIWDVKIIWGLFNWLMYSILFVLRQSRKLNNPKFARGIVLLFVFIIFSFLFPSHQLPISEPIPPEKFDQISN